METIPDSVFISTRQPFLLSSLYFPLITWKGLVGVFIIHVVSIEIWKHYLTSTFQIVSNLQRVI